MPIAKGVVMDEQVWMGFDVYVWNNSVVRTGVTLANGVVIGHLCVIERDTEIGSNTTIQSQCHITAEAKIGPNCFFGPGVIMTNEKNIANQGRTEAKIEGAVIGKGVRIGAGSQIAPGVNIGDNAFVLMGSLVTKDIPAGEKWGGRPARKIGIVPTEEYL